MRTALCLLAAAALCTAPLLAPWLEFVLTLAIAKGFAALGVAILLRAGLISIGHAMFYAAGAYAIAFLVRIGVSDFAALLVLSTLIAATAGAVVGAFVIRYRAIFFAMLNLAISMVFYALLSKLYDLTGGSDGMRVGVPTFFGIALAKSGFDMALYYASLVLMVAMGYVMHRFFGSPLGHAVAAVHTNEIRLEYLGISVRLVLLGAYTASAALAGIGGAIAAVSIGHVLPEFAFWTASGHIVLVAVLGGIGGVAGPFVGAFFLELLHTVAAQFTDAWNMIIGIALIGVIFFLPTGLYGLLGSRRRRVA